MYEYLNGNVSGAAQLQNFGGLWIGDRTYADANRSFVPTPDNIKYIPPPEEILDKVMRCTMGHGWGACMERGFFGLGGRGHTTVKYDLGEYPVDGHGAAATVTLAVVS